MDQWHLLIKRGDFELLNKAHAAVSRQFFLWTGTNPHITNFSTGRPHQEDGVWGHFYNPINLGALWLATAEIRLMVGDILISRQGAIMPRKSLKVIKTVTSNDWPASEAKEFVTILKWQGGAHYYVKSSSNAVFDDKYNSAEEAESAIRKVLPNAIIRHKDWTSQPYIYNKQGD